MISCVLLVLLTEIYVSWAQSSEEFQWKFGDNLVVTELSECETYSVIVEPRTDGSNTGVTGVPPYYLLAFIPNGVPTISMIGTDMSNLTWQVNQAAGSEMLLSVVDSEQNNGGQSPTLFSVAGGSSSSCLPSPPSSNISLVANVTDALATCQPWGLRVYGGQKPYTISLAALDSPVVTNVTLGKNDDVFTYIDRADPNGQILAAVSDASGQWGSSTALISTTGSTNVSCVGLISTSGNSSYVDQHPSNFHLQHKAAIIAGIAAPIATILLFAVILVWWRLDRVRRSETRISNPYIAPTPFYPKRSSIMHTSSSKLSYMPNSISRGSSFSHLISLPQQSGTMSEVDVNTAPALETVIPIPPIPRRSSKRERSRLLSESGSSNLNLESTAAGSERERMNIYNEGSRTSIIFQHRDGGTVHELPPPYPDGIIRSNIHGGEQSPFWAI